MKAIVQNATVIYLRSHREIREFADPGRSKNLERCSNARIADYEK